MAQLGFAAKHHRHPLAMGFLEFGMGIHIDHFDVGSQLLAYRLERRQEVIAEVAPGA